MEDILAILFIFGGGTMVALAMSPIGRAVAARIQGGAGRSGDEVSRLQESHQAVLAELDAVRQDVAELQERLDFTERLLARHREEQRLPGAGGPRAPDGVQS